MGDAGFEIDDSRVRPRAKPFVERRAPDVSEIHRPQHAAVCPFGKTQIIDRRIDIALVKDGGARMRHGLIYAAGRHHVPAEKNLHERGSSAMPIGTPFTTCGHSRLLARIMRGRLANVA